MVELLSDILRFVHYEVIHNHHCFGGGEFLKPAYEGSKGEGVVLSCEDLIVDKAAL